MPQIVVQLIGPLTVTGPRGEKLTPKGGKVGALLALLAVAKGRRCTRAWLQDKLWSDRGNQQGQDSLRHAIADLKRSLGPYAGALSIEGRDLSINREAVLVDLYDTLPTHTVPALLSDEFLEGIDVKDREFETWLRQMRLGLIEYPTVQQDGTSLSAIQSGFHISMLPIESYGHSQPAVLIATEVLNRIAASLGHLGPFAIFDHTGTTSSTPTPVNAPDVFLMTRCVDYGDCLNLSLSLRRAIDNKIVWSAMQAIPLSAGNDTEVSAMVLQVTDQIARVLYKPGVLGPADRHQAARLALCGIDKLFSLDSSGLLEADAAFARATELEDKGVYYAWRAYSIVIRASELQEKNSDELKTLANELAGKALSINKNNPLTLALLTQVYAFVFRDFHRAQTLIEPAIAMKSDSLMALDSFALLNFYTGNLDVARDSAVKAAKASVCNPYRYGFATTLCMIDAVVGNYESAITYGERALAMQSPDCPNDYAPTLRYLSAAYDQIGRTDDAKRVYSLLKAQEPSISADAIDPDDYPVPNANARELLKLSFKRIEASLAQEKTQRESDTEHQ